jgi:hypothetical protein
MDSNLYEVERKCTAKPSNLKTQSKTFRCVDEALQFIAKGYIQISNWRLEGICGTIIV